jgi:pyruvate/2-oxoglutarate dehydrogenase complex dihydrolipoamide acyltransferase (E2) component
VAQDLRIPKLGVTMTEGVIAEWLVSDGETVEPGQPVYTLETDKTSTDIEAPAGGRITLVGKVDETYPVGTVIASIA